MNGYRIMPTDETLYGRPVWALFRDGVALVLTVEREWLEEIMAEVVG